MLRRTFRVALATALFVVAAPLTAMADSLEFEADLSPGEEVADPPVESEGEGEAEFTVRRDRVRYNVEWEDLTSGVVMGHIHCGAAGVNGPVGVTLVHEPLDADDGVRGSFTGPDAGNDSGWTTLAQVLGAIASGDAYVNIHTVDFPRGEIRGQLRVDDLEFEFGLDPEQEVRIPPVESNGEGEAELELRRNGVRYNVEWEDLTSAVVMGHIHCGAVGANGPVGVTLVHEPLQADDRVRDTFTGPDAGNQCMWADLGDVLGALASGNAYVNIHTQNFPTGEIRGQVD
jgi:hypothetical protein